MEYGKVLAEAALALLLLTGLCRCEVYAGTKYHGQTGVRDVEDSRLIAEGRQLQYNKLHANDALE